MNDLDVRKGYSAIIKLLRKYSNVINLDASTIEHKIKCHLFGLDLKEKFGLDINPKRIDSTDWYRIGEYISFGWYDGKRRKVSWSDDDKQPKNEYLLQLGFSTGAYIFGSDYPTKFFEAFFLELKSYKPDYSDSSNHNLYWKLENAKDVFNDFKSILEKYSKLNKEDFKKREIERKEKELELLKNS